MALVHVFQQAGYKVLNGAKTIMRANDLHPKTKALVDELKKENIDELLSRTLVKKPTDADYSIPAEEPVKKEMATEKLTVRLSPWEKERLIKFAAEMQLNQRQTVQYLISKCCFKDDIFPAWEDDPYVRVLLKAYRDDNQRLKDENENLKEQLSPGRKNKLDRKEQQIQNIRSGVAVFFGMMQPNGKIPLEVERGLYKDCPHTDQYHYPEKAGVYILRPTSNLCGKGRYPAIFILGLGDDGECLKFRFYPKSYFAGVNPKNEKFWLRGSVWLIGCEQVNDAAMDMTFAFPLDVRFRYNGPDEYGAQWRRGVADLMQEIKEYN